MCWNTRNWELPSGSTDDSGYPGENGFGHEEWNFQLNDALSDHIYGYLYYRPSSKTLELSKNIFSIGFWTLNPHTKEKLLVGTYNGASYIDNDNEYKLLNAHFEKSGIYRRRIDELMTANPKLGLSRAKNEVYYSVRKKWLNFKCPVNQVFYYGLSSNNILPDIISGKHLSNRYTKPLIINSLDNTIINKKAGKQTVGSNKIPLVEDGYYREISENLMFITKKHNIISNKLKIWLSNNGYKNILQENNRVDIECVDSNNNICRIEIKVSHGIGTTKSIREALGQLLEYNHYGNRIEANKWIIILDIKPSQYDINYLCTIKSKYKLPLLLGWNSGDDFTIIDLQ